MRTDSTGDAIPSTSAILDAGADRMIMLWHDSKRADVMDWRMFSSPGSGSGYEVEQSMTATNQSRQIAGWTCLVYNVRGSFRMKAMETVGATTFVTEDSVCLVENGPGQADFSALHRAIAERAPVRDPTRALHEQAAEIGVPFATKLTFRAGAHGPTGDVTQEISTYTTEVLSVSTAPIPDSIFDIPAGYTVTTR